MALFTDGIINTISDLKAYESSILAVAHTEGIDLARKLELAQREIGLALAAYLVQRGISLDRERSLSGVIVTEPVVHWHAMQSLALVYRDAYNSQMNDRYRGKWEEFQRLAAKAQRMLLDIGVGMTSSPLARPPMPVVGTVGGSVLPAATYFVRLAWLGASGVTSAWSEAAVIGADPGMRLTVQIPAAPAAATGAVVYAGIEDAVLSRQNEAALAPGSTWTQPASGLRADLPALRVQGPDYYVANRREMLRG